MSFKDFNALNTYSDIYHGTCFYKITTQLIISKEKQKIQKSFDPLKSPWFLLLEIL